ncbi:MAG: hypothetical protein JGK04_09930 [Microcoleus sp. PH2017_39_LGB_O_B]|nr:MULTISPECIES: hypothetical protein [unclassified Microcoleus]MCC3450212.1 hypothetical protein [Microcoleus sp. PH2017_09_SFU_O_A]MCC3628744.1 hypothetical protein [Microcoleus sp. PH2017_39_LGB_O_B]MCC3640839.1 hypothetical protein [Microcoleus sp. PH2017_33_LGB_O_A]
MVAYPLSDRPSKKGRSPFLFFPLGAIANSLLIAIETRIEQAGCLLHNY